MAEEDRKVQRAREIAVAKLGFVRHAIVYVFVIAVLVVINNVTYSEYQWWVWPALGWGIGVIAHFLSAFLFQSGRLEDRLVRRELERMEDDES